MGVFFITWQLWEEMTFVLGCAIVVVFLIGVYKLWSTSRQVRRQEAIDEEKRARRSEMRKAGASPTRPRPTTHGYSDIPFGVRAIQTGVEVDGIWISRPTTPGHNSSSSRILVLAAANDASNGAAAAEGKGKRRLSGEYQPVFTGYTPDLGMAHRDAQTTSVSASTSASASSSSASSSSLANDSHAPGSSGAVDAHSNLSTPLPRISEDATSMATGCVHARALNKDALRQLEETYAPTGFAGPGSNSAALRPPSVNTYVPSSRVSSPSPGANLLSDYAE